jgi:hypothetical protein
MRHHRFVPQKKFIHGVLVSLDSWSWIWIVGASLAVDSAVPYPFLSVHHRPGLNWLVSQISRSPWPWPRHGMSWGADLGGAGLVVGEDPSEKIYLRLLWPPHASSASRPPKSPDMGREKGVSTRGNRGRLPREERPHRRPGLAGEPSHWLICLAAMPSSGVGGSPPESSPTACGWTGRAQKCCVTSDWERPGLLSRTNDVAEQRVLDVRGSHGAEGHRSWGAIGGLMTSVFHNLEPNTLGTCCDWETTLAR